MKAEASRPLGTTPPRQQESGLTLVVLARCFLRSLLLQASWNTRGMQNLGFLYAMEPALNRLYPDDESRRRANLRHLEPFNTHPYMAAAILGGAIHHETALSEQRVSEDRVTEFKRALAGPLAAIGDTFFWASLRPATAALAVLLAPVIGVWAVVVFLAAYNLIHLGVRIRLFSSGLRLGDGILDAIGSMHMSRVSPTLKQVAAALVGLAALVLVTTFTSSLGYHSLVVSALVLLVGVLCVHPMKILNSPYPILLLVAGLGALLGVLGIVGIQ